MKAWVLAGLVGLAAWAQAGASPDARWSTYTRAGIEALDRGRYAEAKKMFGAALREAEAFRPPDSRLVESLANLAKTYTALHQYVEAEPLLRRAVTIAEAVIGPRHPSVATMLVDYAILLRRLGREAEAATVEARARAILADPTLRPPSTAWVKPGAGEEEFDRDRDGCLQEARYGESQYGPLVDPEVYMKCIERRGWRTTILAPAREGD